MRYGERLREARRDAGLTQAGLVAAIKKACSQENISKLERGTATGSEFTPLFADACGVNARWLADGEGPKHPTGTLDREEGGVVGMSNVEEAPALGPFRRVPVVGAAQLGDNGHWAELEYPVGYGDGYVSYPTRDPNAYALRCKGDSMKPRIQNDEFVVVEPNTPPIPGDEVLVKAVDGRVMVKKFLYERDGRIHLWSVNESHPPQSFAREDLERFHPVVAIVKKALWRP